MSSQTSDGPMSSWPRLRKEARLFLSISLDPLRWIAILFELRAPSSFDDGAEDERCIIVSRRRGRRSPPLKSRPLGGVRWIRRWPAKDAKPKPHGLEDLPNDLERTIR